MLKTRLTAILLITVFTLAVLEVLLRLTGLYYTHGEKTDGKYVSYYNVTLPTWYLNMQRPYDSIISDKPEYHYHDRANNWGFRSAGFDTTANTHSHKILVLGDSFVAGLGAPADSTWPVLLQNILQKTDSARVYNCGIPGSDPFFEYMLLRTRLLALKPAVVIMSINYSDVNDYIMRGGMERFKANGTTVFKRGPWWEPWYKRFHVLRFFMHFALGYDYTLLSPSMHARQVPVALEQIAACADSTRQLCRQNNIRFVVVLHPFIAPHDRYLQKQDCLYVLDSMLRQKDIPVINLFSDILSKVSESNYQSYSWPIDLHYNSRGYMLFAQKLYERLKTEYPQMLQGQ